MCGFEPFIVLRSWERRLIFTVPLSTQVNKLLLANLTLGITITLPWTGIQSRGSRKAPSRLMVEKPELTASPMGHLSCMQIPLKNWRSSLRNAGVAGGGVQITCYWRSHWSEIAQWTTRLSCIIQFFACLVPLRTVLMLCGVSTWHIPEEKSYLGWLLLNIQILCRSAVS